MTEVGGWVELGSPGGGSWDKNSRVVWVGRATALVACSVPFLVAILAAGTSWLPVGDTAVLLLRSSDVLTSSSPSLGMPTSLSAVAGTQLYHPGPAEFWLLHSVSRLDWPVMVVTAVFNFGCILLACAAVRTLAGPRASLVAATCGTAMCAALGGFVLVDPRNPYFATFSLTAFLAAASATAAGHTRWLPVAIAFAAFAAQSQISAAVVVGGATFGTVLAWLTFGRPRDASTRWTLPFAGALGVLLWWPVLWDQAAVGGNLGSLVRAGSASGEHISVGMARDSVAVGLSSWFGGADILRLVRRPPPTWTLVVGTFIVVALVVGLLIALRNRTTTASGTVVVLGAGIAGSIALSRLPDQMTSVLALTNYLWLWPVGAGAATIIIGWIVERSESKAPVVGLAVVALIVGAFSAASPTRPPHFSSTGVVRDALTPLQEKLNDGDTYLFVLADELERFDIGAGLVRGLRLKGVDVVVPAAAKRSFGPIAVSPKDSIEGTLSVGLGRDQAPEGAEIAYGSKVGDTPFVVWLRPQSSADR